MRTLFVVALQLAYFVLAAQNKWTAIMTQSGEGQTYNSFYYPDAVKTFIQDQAKKGQVISELTYGSGKWYAVTTEKTGSTSIAYKWDKNFPNSWITARWDEDKYITKAAWGDGEWAIIMTNNTPYASQSWATRDTWEELETWFKAKWKENTKYNITELVYGNGKWLGVLSVMKVYEAQTFKVSEDFPSSWIQEKYNDKYNISTIESDGKKWYVVMTKWAKQLGETIFNPQTDFPETRIKEQWNKDTRISSLVFAGSKSSETAFDDATWEYLLNDKKDNTAAFNELMESGNKNLTAKKYISAIDDFEAATKLKEKDGTAWNNLAWARYLGGYCYTAMTAVNKSIAIESTAYNNHTKAAILKCQDKCAEAITYFDEAIRLYRKQYGKIDKSLYYADRAEAKKCLKNYTGAVDDIELALTIEPNSSVLKTKLKELNDLANSK